MSIERISTIQTASVLMQPTDAVEPLTLIEKLEQLSDEYLNQYMDYGDKADLSCSVAVDDAINIVKQHSEWVRCDEQTPQDDIAYLVLCDDGSVWMGHYNLPIKPNDWYLHGWSTHEGWHPFAITHFMLPPKPPSEVQDD